MDVFISSLITGMEEHRAAARLAAETLRHRVIAAEDFGASASTPQQVCLQGVRECDVVLLLMGRRYGAVQGSGLSATHEEYREARGHKPVLVFVDSSGDREPEQEAFLTEVSSWEAGGYRASYDTPESLTAAVTRALHELELAQQARPVDDNELVARATAMLPTPASNTIGSGPVLHVVTAACPTQQILRPRDLEAAELHRELAREAVYGDTPVFDPQQGVNPPVVRGATLTLRQADAQVSLDESGNIRVTRPARPSDQRDIAGLPSLIEEEVRGRVRDAILFTGWLLDRVDPSRRLTRVALACRLEGIGYMPWRTRAEAAASPGRATMGSGTPSADSAPVAQPRAALLFDAANQADDITVRLRRQIAP